MAHPQVREALFRHLADHRRGEGKRATIYVDRVGLPTVGIGVLLPTASAVRRFRWFQAGNRMPVDPAVVVAAWTPYRPIGERTASPAGRLAALRGSGATVIPGFVTDEPSIRRAFDDDFIVREDRAKEAMNVNGSMWEQSPADAQFAILLHLWAGQNALRTAEWTNYRAALRRRDWMQAALEVVYRGMRPVRREDLQNAFRNAAFVEQAFVENRVRTKAEMYFPYQFVELVSEFWHGVGAGAA